jgi:hypothetical protein
MNRLFDKGREYLAGAGGWTAVKAMLVDTTVADTGIKAITGATNASPIVITATSHGSADGDVVSILGVGGNLAANGTFRIANSTTHTFELQTLWQTAGAYLNTTGSAAYTSGGVVINMRSDADFLDDLSGARVGTDATLTSLTVTNGNLGAATIAFDAFTGTAQVVVAYAEVGAESADVPLLLIDARVQVVAAATAAASATTIVLQLPLAAALPDNAVLTFSNGATAVLNGAHTAGVRALTVDALAADVTVGHQAEAYQTNPGLPVTSSGAGYNLTGTGGLFVEQLG